MRLPLTIGAVVLAALLVALATVAQAAFRAPQSNSVGSSSSATTTTTTTITTTTIVGGGPTIRLKANKLRRPESCRESLPRKSEDLPALVITGRVKEVYLASSEPPTSAPSTGSGGGSGNGSSNNNNKALVNVGRVIKGNQQLVGSDIIVSGFNSSSATPCPNYVKPNDTWILLLNHDGDKKYSIQNNNILSLNLNNLDRINAIAADEPFKRRGPIDDILCEAHYCPYGRCVANERNQVSCQCPDSCPPLPVPVCGSDNTTYTNECHLIKEGCRRQRPLFVTKETSC